MPPELSAQLPSPHDNGFESLESEMSLEIETSHLRKNRDGHRSQNPTGDHRRNLGSHGPHRHFRLQVPPIMRSRIQIMGSIVPAAPLPHHPPHFEEYGPVA